MIYEVTIHAPAINEVVTTSADSEEQAIERAVASAVQRMLAAGTATARVVAIPDATA
jgi:flavin-binding protein dodecin